MEIASAAGGTAVIDDAEIDELRMMMRGPLLRAGQPGYDEARVIFNGMFDRRPALIARCQGAADVIDAVRFASRRQLLTAVRGGGHSVAGASMCDDGLVIDLSLMDSVVVDHKRRVAHVQGGATWAGVDRETQAFGLATPGGIVSHTGVAGLTLGGGIGWLRNKYGLSCDNLVAANVVTANGDVLTANADENADLFWALRGGGAGFGVVTSFEFSLHPVGPLVAVVFSMYPMAATSNVLKRWREWVASAPEEAASEIAMWTAPAAPGFPDPVRNQDVVIAAGVYAGDPQEGMRVLQPLREFGAPLGEIAGPIPYQTIQRAFDPFFPNTGEVISYWKSLFLDDLTDTAIEIMADCAENRSSRSTMVLVQHIGGAVRRARPDETAFANRDAAFVMNFMGDWRDARETPRHVEWVREAWRRLSPHSTGAVYLNYLGREDRDADSLAQATFGANFDRLAQIKAKYDPTNLFRLNHGVKQFRSSTENP
ncbi:MAG TPA: FAD-binding oxidoreductase [Blastocatellia bacterium]|nr:FAD-binding oxidoreductase [Blastocatellia bacterium]